MTTLFEQSFDAYSFYQILDKLDRGVIMDEVLLLLCQSRLSYVNDDLV